MSKIKCIVTIVIAIAMQFIPSIILVSLPQHLQENQGITLLVLALAVLAEVLLMIAVGIGFLPVSGPHLIFVMLFLQGSLPFSILIANSIAQNVHAGIPLLAQSKRNFLTMKLTTMALGLLAGAVFLLMGI